MILFLSGPVSKSLRCFRRKPQGEEHRNGFECLERADPACELGMLLGQFAGKPVRSSRGMAATSSGSVSGLFVSIVSFGRPCTHEIQASAAL
jgi:hypothetical protein